MAKVVKEKTGKKTDAVKLRNKRKKKKPEFLRQEAGKFKKLKKCWRRPPGRHSKLRRGRKPRGRKPSVGYGSPMEARGLTREGMRPVLVASVDDLKKLDKGKDAAIIRSAVGKKKRAEIIIEAEKTGVTVLNAYRYRLPGGKQ